MRTDVWVDGICFELFTKGKIYSEYYQTIETPKEVRDWILTEILGFKTEFSEFEIEIPNWALKNE